MAGTDVSKVHNDEKWQNGPVAPTDIAAERT